MRPSGHEAIMRLFDYIKTAYKNLMRRKSRTFLTIVAITVGSLSLILMVSIIISIKQSLVKQFQELGAFNLVTVMRDPNSVDSHSLVGTNGDPNEGKKIDDTTLATMRKLNHVAEGTPTTQVNAGTMRLEGEAKKTWGNVLGIDPNNNVFGMEVVAGRKLTEGDMDKIVVGQRFLEEVGFKGAPKDLIGKKVILTIKMGGGSAPDWGPLPEKPPENADKEWWESESNKGTDIPAEIVGVLHNGMMDSGGSYVTLDWAKKLMTSVSWRYPEQTKEQKEHQEQNSKNQGQNFQASQPQMELQKDSWFERQGYSSIFLKVDDQKNLEKLAEEVKVQGYGANTAEEMLDQINEILTGIGIILAVIGGISLFVASIGIINTMIMATYERTREIGVMRACGAKKRTIRRLFTFEAAMLGFWGGVLGMGISYILGTIAKYFVNNSTSAAMSNIPISEIGNFPWWLILSVVAFTTFIGMMSGLYPAHRAAKLNPVEALRYE
ncbi:hypothetical protein A2Y26_00130 [candidate division CPR2 bacterium GWD2_39_7]|nr:MAG: hypothetical protein A2Y26_00130 [candidate division CPR2 bacterium GWD2_39_7]